MSYGTGTMSKEQRILRAMRQVLGRVVRETVPQPGMKSPLSESLTTDIQECFALISVRERELMTENDEQEMRPSFSDEQKTSSTVKFHK